MALPTRVQYRLGHIMPPTWTYVGQTSRGLDGCIERSSTQHYVELYNGHDRKNVPVQVYMEVELYTGAIWTAWMEVTASLTSVGCVKETSR